MKSSRSQYRGWGSGAATAALFAILAAAGQASADEEAVKLLEAEHQVTRILSNAAGVDVEAGTVETNLDTFEGTLLNIIPAQRAGVIAIDAGLAGENGFCPIDASSMRSTMDESVFVIGDASIAGDMPKSGFSANSQAKVAALQIRADLTKSETCPARYSNTWWSLIDAEDGIKVGARYEPKDGKTTSIEGFVSQPGEDAELRKSTYEESIGWYEGIVADIFT